METQTLLQYLSAALPAIPTQGTASSGNMIPQILAMRYGPTLNSKQVRPDPFTSPPAPIRDEPGFHFRFAALVLPRVRHALRAGFEQLAPELLPRQLSAVTLDGGGSAALLDRFSPDTAFVAVDGSYSTSHNRAPGDLKVSWKWRSSMQFSQVLAFQREYRQALAQVNFYMDRHNSRHGFTLTNNEFVALKRLDGNGRLAVATAIPWGSGDIGQPSVLLGLWYLGMLLAEENNWAMNN
ncbi:hypothetical protein V1525DRAFT_457464 [Lipomyces kononenkoae]|uniref:Uncharacterized protein n=1 Tax=Lipomyces kononenkoae TaxID=34357 RepID=A0ACC3T0T4_LIPKO